jgi:CheY-like chemotaxis protein
MASILLIDDDPHVRAFLRILLDGSGHSVAEAADGEEGILACRRQRFDLVLCDLDMPVKDGLATIAELRRDFPGLASSP